MRRLSLCVIALAAAAFADSGDRFYLHYDVLERAVVKAAAENPETWRDYAAGVENPAIAMTAEEVTITLHADYAEIEAVFDFENKAAASVDVEMCFPVSYGMVGADPYDGREEGFTVAGRSAELTVTVEGAGVAYELEDADEGLGFPALAYWPVRFGAGAKRRVVCRYRDEYSGGGGMTQDLSIDYLLYTGATWKGPIGRGVITVQPGDDFDWSVPLYYLRAGVPPARDEGDCIAWEFKNLEPSFRAERGGLPEGGAYYPYEPGAKGAGVTVGFAKPAAMAQTYTYGAYRPPPGEGAAAGALVDGLNFRTEPDTGASRVAGKETLARGEAVALLERRGEWYRARAEGDAEGWVRWRYVDPASGKENIYVELVLTNE